VNAKIRQLLANRKRRIARRLDKTKLGNVDQPMFAAANIHYEIAQRTCGLAHGGIGAIHALARRLGLIEAIDRRLHLLKIHLPFHESDHVLNFAYNALCEGTCLQDMELRRNDEVFLDALGARRIPDPTTAGDFCRRFRAQDIHTLQEIFHETRLRVWAQQPAAFFARAVIDMEAQAEQLPEKAWKTLARPPRYHAQGPRRRRADNVKEAIVRQRQFETLRLQCEHVAEFNYQSAACRQGYRMIVVRKNISKEKGEERLLDEIRYFFYLTNEWVAEPEELVLGPEGANGRCQQENVLAQLHGGCCVLRAAVDNLTSNWAYMVMTGLAWNLKAWWALLLPEKPGRWQASHQEQKRWVLGLEFRSFVQAFVRLPCQLVRTGRQLVYRLLSWNPHQPILFRLLDVLRC
jgi:hypothetical protein